MGMSKSRGCFGYPLSIFFIVVNEFCERFSYYGMRALLVLYFRNFLNWDDDLSTAIYHTFVALCYLTPILGALIADSWLGKFKTIISLSIVYTIGQAVISVSSINDLTDHDHNGTPDSLPVHVALSMIGLALIALGTGGIKPCVSAFGGDQFEEGQEKQRNRFFSIFYLAINAGSLISTIITPILRVQQCGIHSQQACYPLAFGVPAALMAVSLIVFVLGSRMYKKFQPQGNIMGKVAKCIGKTLPVFPSGNQVQIKVLNIGNNDMTVYFPGENVTLAQMSQTDTFMTFDIDKLTSINVSSSGSSGVATVAPQFEQGQRHTLLVWDPSEYLVVNDGLNQKPEKGENGIRFVNTLNEMITIEMSGKVYENVTSHSATNYQFFLSGEKHYTINTTEVAPNCPTDFKSSNLDFGSAYTYVIRRASDGCLEVKEFEDIPPNTVNMALQIPQYFLLTCGEVVFSVTGLEFSYSQAPSNMKSVLQAGWLLTVAVGNIIVLIVAGAGHFSEQWAEYVLFASLLLVVCIIFAIMARFYTYVNPAEIEAQFDEDEKKKGVGKENPYSALEPVSQTKM
ncbi:solute carrier family 15 member 1 [Grammomys surdaster]|uniref:solute carrier family 15 member 1 n=1 Tax=Grammomys surdaster TaxID=491861 RepID=UPI00109FE9E4|nr:solute carrier family 15 member 1 [Grammomys surdaster]